METVLWLCPAFFNFQYIYPRTFHFALRFNRKMAHISASHDVLVVTLRVTSRVCPPCIHCPLPSVVLAFWFLSYIPFNWSHDSLLVVSLTHDRKVVSLSPGRSGGGIFFSRVNFLCWFLLSVHSIPCYCSGMQKTLFNLPKVQVEGYI